MNTRMRILDRHAIKFSVLILLTALVGCNDTLVSPPTRLAAHHDYVASSSRLAFVRGGRIYSINADGTDLVQLTSGPSDCSPAWSPDGQRIAFVRGCNSQPDVYVMDADGNNLQRRTNHGSWTGDPSWSPDGRQLAYTAVTDGSLNVFVISADADGTEPRLVVGRPGWNSQPAWSPDGTGIAFVSDWIAFDFTEDIFVVTPDGAQIRQITNGFGFGSSLIQYYQPAWSPDGQRLAVVTCFIEYVTCGTSTVAVMNSDGSGRRTLATTSGFAKPTWSPDGATIAYATGDGRIAWVAADGGESGVIVYNGTSPAWRP